MTDQNQPENTLPDQAQEERELKDEGLSPVDENDALLAETAGSDTSFELDPVTGEPDSYPGAAEDNPDHWQEDPLLQGEVGDADAEVPPSEQDLRDESEEARYEAGEEQVPPGTPTLGEAAADVDFGEVPTGDEADASNDPSNSGGSPLGGMDVDELD
ncbi:hypothetical protein PSET11_03329 [Arthrobacter ulcerisalmonis]|uniref:DUF5709 domain-containing protein n=1 Tax=Arthrobacter ulcerisalmonis TaxID=2483813 RepID=A0A3P5XNV8_9MICC|nr:hypothetical protein [Arthrobacter ulcerisalmonis]VDC33370.1 hypothetical protein PSET11_03329 [Arthrobacter ulcerisalmonis]